MIILLILNPLWINSLSSSYEITSPHKYAKFLILRHDTYRPGQNDSTFGIANLFLGVEAGDKDYRNIV